MVTQANTKCNKIGKATTAEYSNKVMYNVNGRVQRVQTTKKTINYRRKREHNEYKVCVEQLQEKQYLLQSVPVGTSNMWTPMTRARYHI